MGLHNIFLKAKESSYRLKGQFWSTLLFVFYLEAIYLPTLQRQVRLWQTNNFVRLWFTETCLYRVYLPLLIRLANDVETNPGPIFSINSSDIIQKGVSPAMSVLTYRLSQLGLRPVDVGGAGDCFFRAVSHQLFGSSDNHLQIRAEGIEHLRDHPEHFIESIVEHSWLHYLNNMGRQEHGVTMLLYRQWPMPSTVQFISQKVLKTFQRLLLYILWVHKEWKED